MQILRELPPAPLRTPSFLTIGNFDGVHLGHQELVNRMVAAAHSQGCVAGALTFHPHPLAVLRPEMRLSHLSSPEERAGALEALGLDFLLEMPFTRETAATPAERFVEMLARGLALRELWIGPDFALGRGREGTPDRLAELGLEYGYQVRTVGPFSAEGAPVHSSRIRDLLRIEGDAEGAARLLGRPYELHGVVRRGQGRGRGLGFPTANIEPPDGRLIPAYGVYACWAWVGGKGIPAAVSIGVRPTFDNGLPTVEAYLLDYDGDLYDQPVGLSFIRRLRRELRFESASSLVAQMEHDVAVAREILARPPDPSESDPGSWTEIDHTADWAIEVTAHSQRALFARAARAMFALQQADTARPPVLARSIAVNARGGGVDDLLIAWLNALLLQQEIHEEMYTHFGMYEVSRSGLRAVAYGHAGYPVHTAVKAVTYYDLLVEENESGWSARVTFDV